MPCDLSGLYRTVLLHIRAINPYREPCTGLYCYWSVPKMGCPVTAVTQHNISFCKNRGQNLM